MSKQNIVLKVSMFVNSLHSDGVDI